MDLVVVDAVVGAMSGGATAGLGKVGEAAVTKTAREAGELYRRLRDKVIGALGDSGATAVDDVEADPSSEQSLGQLRGLLLAADPHDEEDIVDLAKLLHQRMTASNGGVLISQNQVHGDQNLTTIGTVQGELHIGRRGDDANPR